MLCMQLVLLYRESGQFSLKLLPKNHRIRVPADYLTLAFLGRSPSERSGHSGRITVPFATMHSARNDSEIGSLESIL